MLALYGHPFSSYTWKAQIALYANETPFEFRLVDGDHPDHVAIVQSAGPQGKFPVLVDGAATIFEATTIIEYLGVHYPGEHRFVPDGADAAIRTRMLDRVFDNYVMNAVQAAVEEAIRHPGAPDPELLEEVAGKLGRTYAWLERWLESRGPGGSAITLIECAAAPSLFYADWVHQITRDFPRLKAWRAHLNALPPVSRCIEAARPFRAYFPLGAPDRD